MKTPIIILTVVCTLAPLHAQGPLTPPGVPAPTMKSLSQVEPRIAVQSLAVAPPYTISQPGSYYLTGNITVSSGDAIEITASDVSLDLMGFTIESTAASAEGAAIHGQTISRLKICNGNIKSGSTVNMGTLTARGFYWGIYGIKLSDSTICDMRVSGTGFIGIWCDQNGVVERCTVADSDYGIKNPPIGAYSSITRNCSVVNCRNAAIAGAMVDGCYGYGFHGPGISATVASNSQGGTQTGTGMTVAVCAQNCAGYSGVGTGMDGTGATVTGCNASTVGGSYSLIAKIAIGCVINNGMSGSANITNRYNMP